MVLEWLKHFFNRLGGMTVDSTKKVGDKVSVPVEKLNEIGNRAGKVRSGIKTSSSKSKKSSKGLKLSSKTQSL